MPQCDRIVGALETSGGRARRGVHVSIPDR